MRPWLRLRRWLVVAVSQRLPVQDCTDDTNALDGDPEVVNPRASGLKIATFSKAAEEAASVV